VRYEKPGTIQRSMVACVSSIDANEAEMAGRAAVRFALDGHTDEMVTLVRGPGEGYSCKAGVVSLAEVAGQVRTMPNEYLDGAGSFVNPAFIDYVRPLVGRLPRFGRLR
jgi:6-phosphofructokinase 1